MAAPLSPIEVGTVLDRLTARLASRRKDADKWMSYYRGSQGALLFASEDFRQSCGSRFDGFSDNWCAPVAAAGAERLALRGLKLPGSELSSMSPDESKLWGALQDNGMDAQLAQAFLQSRIQRRAFVSVWAYPAGSENAGEPLMAAESASQAIVEYDAEVRWHRRFGLKQWADDQYEYATLSSPDYIYRMRRPLGSLAGVRPSGIHVPSMLGLGWSPVDAEGQPIRNHLGLVPLVELPFLPPLDGDPLSAISGVAAMQDAVNLLWAYLFNAADYASMPARVVLGQGPPKRPILDDKGQKIGEAPIDMEELKNGRLLWLSGQTTTIDKWDSAVLDPFTSTIENIVAHIATQTRTPPYYLVTRQGISNIGGDGIKALDAPAVEQVRTVVEHYNGRIRDILTLVARQLDLGDVGTQRARIQWRDFENRSDAQKADAFLKRVQAGYPFEWLLIEDGKSPEEIEMIMRLKEKEATDPVVAKLTSRLLDNAPA